MTTNRERDLLETIRKVEGCIGKLNNLVSTNYTALAILEMVSDLEDVKSKILLLHYEMYVED